ncbi:MAG: translation initiation factor [Campylobacterales bacterium]|nr:translation initiation factor [Campylobacterales bacterium]
MGAILDEGWQSDNKQKASKETAGEIKEPGKHQLHFAKEKRNGKTVTIVKPFYLEKETLQNLLKTLKKKLGCGGTIKENILEFQGEIADILRKQLEELGYRFKK